MKRLWIFGSICVALSISAVILINPQAQVPKSYGSSSRPLGTGTMKSMLWTPAEMVHAT